MVSIIIPTYNRAKTIGRSIESILNQTYRDLELIIVDDGSTDNTEEIVNRYMQNDSRIQYIKQKQNQGACVARNVGIDIAIGEYIGFQDSDDESLPERLETQIECLNINNADICICGKRRIYPDGREEIIQHPGYNESGIIPYEVTCTQPFISGGDLLARAYILKNNLFDPIVKRQQDYEWGLRGARNHRVWFESRILYVVYAGPDSITAQSIEIRLAQREYFIKKYPELCRENPNFHIYQLETMRIDKARAGMNYTDEYRRICEISGSLEHYLKFFLSWIGITGLINRLRNMVRDRK